jgi:hypothetical protein
LAIRLAQLPPDPATITAMIPVRQAEIEARGAQPCSTDPGHGAVIPRPLESQSYEQMFCGVWYDCGDEGCTGNVHYLSRELAAYHSEPYVICEGEYEAWDGSRWVPVTRAQFDTYWARRRAATEQQHKEMTRRARALRSSPGPEIDL